MKERPITFVGESTSAILAGRKTQTRRMIKPQPLNLIDAVRYKACPYGFPGDRLWVRETWAAPTSLDRRKPSNIEEWHPILYRADGFIARQFAADKNWLSFMFGKWRPPRYMPRWASRITLEITGIRVERVQDITFDDAIAEGVFADFDPPDGHGFRSESIRMYRRLWDEINAERGYSWDTNPWVFVIEFKVVKGGER